MIRPVVGDLMISMVIAVRPNGGISFGLQRSSDSDVWWMPMMTPINSWADFFKRAIPSGALEQANMSIKVKVSLS